MNGKAMRWTGYALTGLFTLFMLFDVGIKLARHPMVEKTMAELGFPAGLGFPIGVIEALCLVLYLVPRTAVPGAVLFTGLCLWLSAGGRRTVSSEQEAASSTAP